jgi:hypothetical protein
MNNKPNALMLLGLLSIACNEYEIKNTEEANNDLSTDGVPDITVDPVSISFPELNAADGLEHTEVVVIGNQGDADLHISDIYLDDLSGPFTLGAISSALVPPGSQAQFAVTFAPNTAETSDGLVLIDSDDPDTPTAEVTLLGSGIAPIVEVNPSAYDFGVLYIGCDSGQPLAIKNIGNAPLIVDRFDFQTASQDLTFDAQEAINNPLPWTIPPNQTKTVFVDYAPMDEAPDAAYLTVFSNDPYTPEKLVTQEGMGDRYGENIDEFVQPEEGATDILFAVDRSCSMNDDIQNVQDNFGTFTSTLSSMNADYHVAATVEDSGCINGTDLYIDNSFSAADSISTITTMINLAGSYGSNTERAFMLLESSLAQSLGSGCNSGLIREDATLALVGVSDEPEQSVNNYSYYISLFQGLKNNPDDVIMHAIGGDYPSGCGSADSYTGFYEATVATGGLFLSICSTDWGAHLQALAEGSTTDLSSFELTDWPVPETIIVRLDGLQTTVGWEYNPTDNSIDFDPDHVPEGGATITVEYTLFGDCEQ